MESTGLVFCINIKPIVSSLMKRHYRTSTFITKIELDELDIACLDDRYQILTTEKTN